MIKNEKKEVSEMDKHTTTYDLIKELKQKLKGEKK